MSFSNLTFVAIQAALKSGEILKRGFGTPFTVSLKPGVQNFVTEYDLLSEETIVSLVHDYFPDHSILAEEGGLQERSDDGYIWIIDPLDGTTNFSHHIPLFVVSIAVYKKNEPLCGVIFQPMTQELFVAEKGKGAFLNGSRLAVSRSNSIVESIMGIGFPYDIEERALHSIDHLTHLTVKGMSLRNIGSAALNLAYIAAGKFDGLWFSKLQPWDIAAGKLLIEEAGGCITDYYGLPIDIYSSPSVLATNGLIHDEALSYINVNE